MPTSFYASKKRGYIAIKQEATPAVAVKPTHFCYLYDESVKTDYKSEVVDVAAGLRTENYAMVAAENTAPGGGISLPIQADTIGYFLASAMGNPTITGPTDSAYEATFVSGADGNIPTASVEIGNKDAKYARRYCGSVFGGMNFGQKANAWSADFTMMSRYAFVLARVVGAHSAGAVTTELDTNHGLVVGDKIKLGFLTANEEEVTLTSVNVNGTTVGHLATSNSHADAVPVVLSPATTSYSTATPQYQWIGGTTTMFGEDLGSATALARFKDFSLSINQKLEPEYAPNGTTDFSRYPTDIFVDTYGSTTSFNVTHKDVTFLDYMRTRTDVAVDVTTTGNLIGAASRDTFQIQVPKLRMNSDTPALAGSGISTESITGQNQHSLSESCDVKIVLTNALANYTG